MLRSPWTWVGFTAAAIAVGAVVFWPVLQIGYFADDYLQRAMLEGTYPAWRSPLDLYNFSRPGAEAKQLMEGDVLPWWTHPDLRLRGLRPLASLSLWLDHTLGLSAYARHLHSLVWWTAFLALASVLARRLLPLGAAVPAVLVLALDPSRVFPIGWIANRTELMCGAFGILALYLHVLWREDGWKRGMLLTPLAWALALASGEYGLCAIAFVASYELCVQTGPWRERARALLPAAVPTLVYLTAYALLGFGARATSLYVSPLSAPGEFLGYAAERFRSLLENEVLLVSTEGTHLPLAVGFAGSVWPLLLLFLVGFFLYRTSKDTTDATGRLVRLAGVGLLGSVLPLIGTVPATRLLLIPSVAGSWIVGLLLWDLARRVTAGLDWRRLAGIVPRSIVTVFLLGLHLVVATAVSIRIQQFLGAAQAVVQIAFRHAPIDPARTPELDLVLVNALDPSSLIYVPFVRRDYGSPMPRSWRALAMSVQPVHVARVAPSALELYTERGSLLDHPLATALRDAKLPFRPGESVRLDRVGLTIEILGIRESGPNRVRFRFDRSLDDPSLYFLVITPNGIQQFDIPAMGEERVARFDR